jgi:putative membrane protein
MKILMNWLIYTLAITITAYLLPGVTVAGLGVALITALVLGLINAVLRPVFIFFTLPLTIISLGLFVFIINALLVLLAGYLVTGFMVAGFWWALLFSLIVSVINWILNGLVRRSE